MGWWNWDQIAGCRVRHGEVHGEGAEAAVAGEPECRMLVEDLSIQVNTDVGLHILWTVVQYLKLMDIDVVN